MYGSGFLELIQKFPNLQVGYSIEGTRIDLGDKTIFLKASAGKPTLKATLLDKGITLDESDIEELFRFIQSAKPPLVESPVDVQEFTTANGDIVLKIGTTNKNGVHILFNPVEEDFVDLYKRTGGIPNITDKRIRSIWRETMDEIDRQIERQERLQQLQEGENNFQTIPLTDTDRNALENETADERRERIRRTFRGLSVAASRAANAGDSGSESDSDAPNPPPARFPPAQGDGRYAPREEVEYTGGVNYEKVRQEMEKIRRQGDFFYKLGFDNGLIGDEFLGQKFRNNGGKTEDDNDEFDRGVKARKKFDASGTKEYRYDLSGGRYVPRMSEDEFILPFSDSQGYQNFGFGRSGGALSYNYGRPFNEWGGGRFYPQPYQPEESRLNPSIGNLL